jgi:hypothetical protein
MQTLTARLACDFADDANAILTGACRLAVIMTRDAWETVTAKATAPLDRMARACDVGGVLDIRRAKRNFDILGVRRLFRSLNNLT